MGRPHKYRHLSPHFRPPTNFFQPVGMAESDKIFLTAEELEALRLRYYGDKKNQTDAARIMAISQTTYSRILNSAFEKITKAFMEGKGIMFQSAPNLPVKPIWNTPPSQNPWNNPSPKPLSQNVVFDGFGCLECGYQWEQEENKLDEKDLEISAKKQCPECKGTKTYRLIKKGPPQ